MIDCVRGKHPKDVVRLVNLDALTYSGNLANTVDVNDTRYRFVLGSINDRLHNTLFPNAKSSWLRHRSTLMLHPTLNATAQVVVSNGVGRSRIAG